MTRCIVNDIDGRAVHTVDAGPLDEVRARADERLRRQIDDALANDDGESTETYEDDRGEVYTTKVVIR